MTLPAEAPHPACVRGTPIASLRSAARDTATPRKSWNVSNASLPSMGVSSSRTLPSGSHPAAHLCDGVGPVLGPQELQACSFDARSFAPGAYHEEAHERPAANSSFETDPARTRPSVKRTDHRAGEREPSRAGPRTGLEGGARSRLRRRRRRTVREGERLVGIGTWKEHPSALRRRRPDRMRSMSIPGTSSLRSSASSAEIPPEPQATSSTDVKRIRARTRTPRSGGLEPPDLA